MPEPSAAEALPDDWRERMVEMVRGAAELDGRWFTGGPVCSPEAQIGIYANQYRLRLYDALREELIGLVHLLDPADGGEALLRRFLHEHPSRSWTLNRVADGLAAWLDDRARAGEVPLAWVEMARLDWAVQAGFEAAAGPPLDAAALVSVPKLALQPHVFLLRASHNVHDVRAALLSRAEVPALAEGDFPIVVFRRGIGMRTWVVPLGLWGILDAIRRGKPLTAAFDEVFERGYATVDDLTANVGRWFADLAERDIVTARDAR